LSKSFLRASKASGSTKRRVEKIIQRGLRATRRQFVAAARRKLPGELSERGTVYA
jgi:hypothetical protein